MSKRDLAESQKGRGSFFGSLAPGFVRQYEEKVKTNAKKRQIQRQIPGLWKKNEDEDEAEETDAVIEEEGGSVAQRVLYVTDYDQELNLFSEQMLNESIEQQ